jgi:hypothetical protein
MEMRDQVNPLCLIVSNLTPNPFPSGKGNKIF